MARNNPKRQQDNTPGFGPGETPPMPGGSPGVVIPEGDKRLGPAALVTNGLVGSAKQPDPTGPVAQAREYQVVTGPGDGSANGIMVLHNKVKVRLMRGKVISDTNMDIESLTRQGVQLREITPPPPVVVPEEPAPEPETEETGTED